MYFQIKKTFYMHITNMKKKKKKKTHVSQIKKIFFLGNIIVRVKYFLK